MLPCRSFKRGNQMRNPSVLRSTPFPFPQSDMILRSSTCANFEAPCSLSLYLAMGCAQLRAGCRRWGNGTSARLTHLPCLPLLPQLRSWRASRRTHMCVLVRSPGRMHALSHACSQTRSLLRMQTRCTLARSHTHSMHAFIRVYVYVYIYIAVPLTQQL